MIDFGATTTEANVKIYESAKGMFAALLHEVRELSKKKPDATLSDSKVKLINNVLNDLMTFLKQEPEGKYLHILENESLPQVSDALLMMVQFDAALDAFRERYYRYVGADGFRRGETCWITEERLAEWEAVENEDD